MMKCDESKGDTRDSSVRRTKLIRRLEHARRIMSWIWDSFGGIELVLNPHPRLDDAV